MHFKALATCVVSTATLPKNVGVSLRTVRENIMDSVGHQVTQRLTSTKVEKEEPRRNVKGNGKKG